MTNKTVNHYITNVPNNLLPGSYDTELTSIIENDSKIAITAKFIGNTTETLEELTEIWRSSKLAEQEANRERLSAEARILELCHDQIKEKGTTNLPTGIKIVTSFTEKWDQESIAERYNDWCSDLPFPFKTEFKPIKELMDVISENEPSVFGEIQAALTLSPSKPSFSYVERK